MTITGKWHGCHFKNSTWRTSVKSIQGASPDTNARVYLMGELSGVVSLQIQTKLCTVGIWITNFSLFAFQMPSDSLLFKPQPEYISKRFFDSSHQSRNLSVKQPLTWITNYWWILDENNFAPICWLSILHEHDENVNFKRFSSCSHSKMI